MHILICTCVSTCACLLFSLIFLNQLANVIRVCHGRPKDVIIPAGSVTVGDQGEARHYIYVQREAKAP